MQCSFASGIVAEQEASGVVDTKRRPGFSVQNLESDLAVARVREEH
jgi:hypothetical protein